MLHGNLVTKDRQYFHLMGFKEFLLFFWLGFAFIFYTWRIALQNLMTNEGNNACSGAVLKDTWKKECKSSGNLKQWNMFTWLWHLKKLKPHGECCIFCLTKTKQNETKQIYFSCLCLIKIKCSSKCYPWT